MPPQGTLREPLLENDQLHDATLTLPSPPRRRAHRNVTLTLLYTIFAFVGSSIWGSNVLSTYVYLLEDRKAEAVGYFTGIMGLSNLLCSLPAGYLSDLHRRDTVLRFAAVVRAVAISLTIYALVRSSYIHLLGALAIWGSSRGMANTALGAIFADSIEDGKRSYYFTQRTMLRTVGSTAGPIASLVMFSLLGDHWTVQDCTIVLIVGQVISVVAMLILCFFSDDFIVEENNELEARLLEESQDGPARAEEGQHTLPEDNSDRMVVDDTNHSENTGWFRQRRVALMLAGSDVLTGLASGMSVRYFPIFFVKNLKLGPVMVQILYVFGPLMQTCLMKVSQRLSKRLGRCFISALFRWIGVGLMFSLIVAYHVGLPIWFVCLLYVLRTGFMNGTKALTRSLLMDSVPKEERGRWSALESVNTLSWSGSAVLGGFLVGALGVVPLFAITACLQICSTIPLILLFGKDDPLEDQKATNASVAQPGVLPPVEERQEEDGSQHGDGLSDT